MCARVLARVYGHIDMYSGVKACQSLWVIIGTVGRTVEARGIWVAQKAMECVSSEDLL